MEFKSITFRGKCANILKAKLETKKSNIFLALNVTYFIDLFSKLRSNKESFNNIVHHRAIKRGQYGLISKK